MASTSGTPTARRRQLASRLRALRLEAGKSIDDAATQLMCSPAKISRLETGGRGIARRDVRDLCLYYGVAVDVMAELLRMAEEPSKPTWWQDYRSIDDQTTTFIDLEAAASEIRVVETRVVHGLLQTPEVTRDILRDMRAPGELTSEWIEDTVALRARRQLRLTRGEIDFRCVMDETAFRRLSYRPEIECAQLERIVELGKLPTVTVLVVPFDRGPYPGWDGSFQHLRFFSGLGDVVHVEGLMGNYILDRATVTNRYLAIFDHICRVAALSASDSLDWIMARWETASGKAVGSPGRS